MYYVASGSIPRQRHPAPRARRLALRRGAVRRRGLHRPRSLALPPHAADADPQDRAGQLIRLEADDDDVHRHPPDQDRRSRAEWRHRQRPDPAVLQQRRGVRRRATRGADAGGYLHRNGIADEMLFVHEGSGMCDTVLGPLAYGPGDYLVLPIGTTWRLDPAPDLPQRILYLGAPSEIEPPKRYRNDYGQPLEHSPYSQRDIHAPDEVALEPMTSSSMSARRTGSPRITTGITRSTSWGWDVVPLAVPVQHRRLPADHRAGPPAATRPPDVPGPQLRGLLVFVPRKFDYHPLAIPRRTTTRTSTPTRSSTTSPATS